MVSLAERDERRIIFYECRAREALSEHIPQGLAIPPRQILQRDEDIAIARDPARRILVPPMSKRMYIYLIFFLNSSIIGTCSGSVP